MDRSCRGRADEAFAVDYIQLIVVDDPGEEKLQFIQHEEGRVVMTGSAPEYQYHLKDHLGNVRLTFTTKDEVDESLATMETANEDDENSKFLFYDEAVKVNAYPPVPRPLVFRLKI